MVGSRLLACGLLAVSLGIPGASQARADAAGPNFIVIIADDVGWNDLGCYGHPRIKTPNFDRMAAEGLRFANAFLTCSSCSPSRCSIMTGRYPHSTGAAELHQGLPADQIVFPGLLRDAGYYTAAAGKWHLGETAKKSFDRIEGGGPSGCERWLAVLRERPRDKPFFFWFASFDAHRGYQRNTIVEPHTLDDAIVPPFLPDAAETRADLALYYDEIARLDRYTGDVLSELKTQGVDEKTMVVFLSDNGRPFPRCKTTVYDSGVRTPLLVRWPGTVKQQGVSQSLVSSVDLAPTILELSGLPVGDSFQGRSFASVLRDPARPARRYVFAEHNWHDYEAHERAVRSSRFLYIRNARPHLPATPPADAVRSPTYALMQKLRDGKQLNADQQGCFLAPRPSEELFDIEADPHSLRNLVEAPEHLATLDRMREVLDRWSERTGDTTPKRLTPDWFDREKGTRIPDVQNQRGQPVGRPGKH